MLTIETLNIAHPDGTYTLETIVPLLGVRLHLEVCNQRRSWEHGKGAFDFVFRGLRKGGRPTLILVVTVPHDDTPRSNNELVNLEAFHSCLYKLEIDHGGALMRHIEITKKRKGLIDWEEIPPPEVFVNSLDLSGLVRFSWGIYGSFPRSYERHLEAYVPLVKTWLDSHSSSIEEYVVSRAGLCSQWWLFQIGESPHSERAHTFKEEIRRITLDSWRESQQLPILEVKDFGAMGDLRQALKNSHLDTKLLAPQRWNWDTSDVQTSISLVIPNE